MNAYNIGQPWKVKYDSFLLRLVTSGRRRLSHWEGELSRKLYIQRFNQRDDDIYIVTYMKSGTTLLQMVLYQMLTDGNMDFKHIYEVSPWLDDAILQNANLNHLPSPRLFKTHASYRDFPSAFKGKVIYGIRDGMDVALSKYYHLKNYGVPELQWDDHFNQFLEEEDHWFKHVSEWLENKNNYPVYYVRYEELIRNMRKTTGQMAAFLNIDLSDEVFERILERCSFSYMKAHQEKFGEQPDNKVYNEFIRKGELFKGKEQLSAEQKKLYQKLYNQYLHRYDLNYNSFEG